MYKKFPHLTNNNSDFPLIDNIDVYKYDNDFDYSRYDYEQMHLQICNVPWDMGEAHIGNRVISGIGNVVYFESAAKRDKWFDDIPNSKCERFDTKFKELHRDMFIDVPIPYDVCARYNYLCVHYELFANENSLVEYEKEGGILDWFWFIREVEFLAPNTTRLHIMLDAFQTFIYDINVTSMILERGHAPMFATNADTYLTDPVNNNQFLLAPDVDFGSTPNIAKHCEEIIFNAGNMKAVIVTTANPYNGSWGTKSGGTWNTPTAYFTVQGTQSYCAFAINASSLSTFLFNVNNDVPQFMQTIKAVCFISSDFLTLGTSFTFANVPCNLISAGYESNTLYTFDKDDFGYPANCKEFAKLYTYPYAQLAITDENGDVTFLKIEDCKGTLSLKSKIGLVWPWLRVNAHLSGVGKTPEKSISFHNISSANISIDGNWFDYLYEWDIPTFGIAQGADVNNDFATHFDRAQAQFAANNQYANEMANANAALADQNNIASNTVAQAALQNALSTALNAASNTKADASCFATQMLNGEQADAAYVFTNATTNNQIDYQYASGSLAAFQSGVNGAVSGGTTLAAGGPYAAAAGAILGGGLGAFGALMGAQAGVNLTSAQARATLDQMLANLMSSDVATGRERDAIITCNNSNLSATTNFNTASAAANASTVNDNATNDYGAASANATNNLSTAANAIANQVKQAALNSQMEYGDFANGETATSRPMGLFCNVVTQNDYAIKRAADEFARYGYQYDGQWMFNGNWNIGKYFTYWKLRDFWIEDISIPDMYIDQIRFFLLEGVTIWSNPESIGKVNIYENASM